MREALRDEPRDDTGDEMAMIPRSGMTSARTHHTSDLRSDGDVFEDRDDAARRLARMLTGMPIVDPIVLGLPRGGVPIAARVAVELHAPMDVLVVRKLGLPAQPEIAFGALGERGVEVLDEGLLRRLAVPADAVLAVERRERAMLDTQVRLLRRDRPPLDLRGHAALIVDDGIATGATASAACRVARALGAQRIIVAAPVASPAATTRIRGADELICLIQPRGFRSVGEYYRHFESTTDEEVAELLALSRRPGDGL